MNEQTLNTDDEQLRIMLSAAAGPEPLSDEEIESMLTSAEPAATLADDQLRRVVGKVQRLLDASSKTAASSEARHLEDAGPLRDQQLRLLSMSTTETSRRPVRFGAVAALMASMLALVSVVALTSNAPSERRISETNVWEDSTHTVLSGMADPQRRRSGQMAPSYRLVAKSMPDAPPVVRVSVGDEITTGNHERRRVTLPDGSVLFVNSDSKVKIATERRVEVTHGEVFVEVVPEFDQPGTKSPFAIVTPQRTVTALGTKFAVTVSDATTDIMVTQGRVRVSGLDNTVAAGQRVEARHLKDAGLLNPILTAAPRPSSELEWTRELMTAATGALVPISEYSGGALVTVDPNGQSSKLSLRKYHVDVHIEDGFARTTIDQTYFNHTWGRLEGTFHFPLPTDASLSRLAMYVNGKLMEGGMAERQHARNTFEQIVHKMQDPALLEWVDGSTFKMRVFPLEPRQEKRIVLSYSQRLNPTDGQLPYRFPAGHTMDAVRDWSAHVRVRGGAGSAWHSDSHALTATTDEAGDLMLDASAKNALMDRDLVLRVKDANGAIRRTGFSARPEIGSKSEISDLKTNDQDGLGSPSYGAAFSAVTHDGQHYLMLRMRPDLPGDLTRSPHHWVFLFERSGDRSPLLARTQIEVIRTLLQNAEHSDRFSIVDASTRSQLYSPEPQHCSPENTVAAISHLEKAHLVGALDLAAALKMCAGAVTENRRETNAVSTVPSPPDQGEKVAVVAPPLSHETGGRGQSQEATPVIVHVGSGMPALGERDASKLAAMIPQNVQYVGIGVGRRWNQALMKLAASRTGGLSTQINPDEDIAWRSFDVFSRLHSPRLVNVRVQPSSQSETTAASTVPSPPGQGEKVADPGAPGDEGVRGESGKPIAESRRESQSPLTLALSPESGERGQLQENAESQEPQFLVFSDLIFQGEEISAICRVPEGQPLPSSVIVTAELNGQPWSQTAAVADVRPQATYLPRHWVKLEIDRLLAENSEQHRETIIGLSKSMYVMSPFTSLLVLENEEMYTQYNIDRGRKDHWALYACPDQIEVVEDKTGEPAPVIEVAPTEPKAPVEILSTIVRLNEPQWMTHPTVYVLRGSTGDDFGVDHYYRDNLWFDTEGRETSQTMLWDSNGNGGIISDGVSFQSFSDRYFLYRNSSAESREYTEYGLSLFGESGNQATNFGSYLRLSRSGFDDDRDRLADLPVLLEDPQSALVRFIVPSEHRFSIPQREQLLLSKQITHEFLGESSLPLEGLEFDELRRWNKAMNGIATDPGISPERRKYFADVNGLLPGMVTDDAQGLTFLGRFSRSEVVDSSGFVFPGEWTTRYRTHGRGTSLLGGKPLTTADFATATAGTFHGHRWSASSVPADPGAGMLPAWSAAPIPVFGHDPRLFGDLMSHAPGLNTSRADVMVVVEEESGKRKADSRSAASGNAANPASTVPSPPGQGEKVAGRPDEGAASGDAPSGEKLIAESQSPLTLTLSPETGARGQSQESGKPKAESRLGRVDDAARALIDKARSRGWESITLGGRENEAGVTIHYDGQGRHVWERVVSEGLREHVACDGSTLWHIYREIGLASKRPFSRFHHQDLTAIVPWLLPSADELARGADVVAVDERTVAVVPRRTDLSASSDEKDSESEISNLKSKDQDGAGDSSDEIASTHLIFSDDGRLLERRYINTSTNKVLSRLFFDADGTVKLLDVDEKELASMKLHRALSSPPQLVPDLNGLVVLPMPVRTPEMLLAAVEKADENVDVADENLPEDDALSLMLAYSANGNGARMVEIARKRFIEKGDMRDGLYVLLSRFPQALVQAAIPADATPGSAATPGFDLRPPVEGSPLRQFLRQHINWIRDQDDSIEFNVDAPVGSLLEHLATARNLFLRWKTDRATKDLTTAQVQQEVERTLAFIAKCRTPEIGWTLMSTMRPRLSSPELLAVFSKAAEPFEQQPQIGLLVRRDRITALFAAGQHEEGRKLFGEWLTVQVEQGFVPPIDAEIYKSFVGIDGQPTMDELLLTISRRLVDARMLQTAQLLAIQIRQLGNTDVADQVLTTILAALDTKQRPDVALRAIEQLRQLKDPRADRLLDQVMELPMADQIPSLWRFASALAADSGRTRLATERLERAMQIEFATRPKVINIETVRNDYLALLAKFEELITASATLEVALPVDLAAHIIQAADQWRTLDDDDTAACQTASRMLAKLNMKDLAWDYLTTPLAENSGESAPWIALARTLATDEETDLAHTAWGRAFEFESTNPEILLEHAKMLVTTGRAAIARKLLEQVVSGTWQPRFSGIVEQARSEMKGLPK